MIHFKRNIIQYKNGYKYLKRSFETAIESAKNVSYTRGLFLGINNVERAFPYPTLSQEEKDTLQMLVDPVKRYFKENINSKEIDETKTIPTKVLNDLKEMGLFGLQIPTEYNGLGLSNTGYARICEELSVDASLAVTIMAHQSIGLKGILLNGNEEQKKKYLPKLATGEHLAAFALTESGSGSDAASIKTTAVRSPDNKYYILNGSKIWISNGGWAEIMTVFAQTEVYNSKTNKNENKVTAFIVERSFPGVTSGPPEDKLGIRGSNTCEVHFENVKIPIENILGGGPEMKTGGEAGVGQGFKVAMNILNNGRFGLGAAAGSMVKKVLGVATEHATTRKQFGSTLSSFGLIKEKFGIIAMNAYAIESMAFMTTGMIDRGDPSCEIEAAMCKVFGSEIAFEGINECIQIMGGTGFMRDWPFERYMRDCRILSIFEGTNEILRMLIALSGIRTAGDRLSNMVSFLKNPLKNPSKLVNEFTDRFQKKFNPQSLNGIHPSLQETALLLQKRTNEFGDIIEYLLRQHGKNIISQQLQLKRVADAAIYLFAMTATISRASSALKDRSYEGVEHEKKLCELFCQKASNCIIDNISQIKENKEMDTKLEDIADDVFRVCKYIPKHPIGVDS